MILIPSRNSSWTSSSAAARLERDGGARIVLKECGAMTKREQAREPEDLARLFVERANAGDAAGLAELYEPDAVLGFPPGEQTVGREAIRAVCEKLIASGM